MNHQAFFSVGGGRKVKEGGGSRELGVEGGKWGVGGKWGERTEYCKHIILIARHAVKVLYSNPLNRTPFNQPPEMCTPLYKGHFSIKLVC